MFVSIFLSAFLVCSAVATTTLPNGFTFDETQYLDLKSRANYALEKCEMPYEGCSNDCTSKMRCDGSYNVIEARPCYNEEYCVKGNAGSILCTGIFPMSNQACLTKAINNFVCTEDGEFPDPTDCAKYHVCNGTAHYITECAASHHFMSTEVDKYDPYTNPGSSKFTCQFRNGYDTCTCHQFYCNGTPNTFTFRYTDYFHYAYCLQIGTSKKIMMFKCPSGTRHFAEVSAAGSVDCVPIGA